MSWFFDVITVCFYNKYNIFKPAFLTGKTIKSIAVVDIQKFLSIFSGDGQ